MTTPAALLDRMRARPGWRWRLLFVATGALALLLAACCAVTIACGIGVWGTNIPASWAFAIVNFVFWIGVGHAGTFISAILYLAEQRWRAPLSRIAETMTLFAVTQAALFPILHLGRPGMAYWLLPYPQTLGVWPQVKSPLPWDAGAIGTYLVVSTLFWYLGLLPDLAALRDREGASRRARRIYGVLALGWRGTALTWRTWKGAYLLLASVATPLVIFVHTIVAMDFSVGLTPGWHSTLLPVIFVVGAVLSGFAMVLVLVIPIRAVFDLRDVITDRHLERLAKLLLVASSFIAYGYLIEAFSAWYSGDVAARGLFHTAAPVALGIAIVGNALVPQLLWSRRIRTSPRLLFVIGIIVVIAMWAERYALIIGSLLRDQMPSAWGTYAPSWVDIGILAGTFGFFGLLYLAFLRLLPFVPVMETTREASA